jgi:hypothetical protein
MHPLEDYLTHLQQILSTGGATKEESYYGVLENLLNEIGKGLKPKVRCVPQLKDTGAGAPDFGLYTAGQFQRAKDEDPTGGQLPERGVVEVKGWSDDSFLTADGAQVSRYWDRYGLVLVTNYRDFVLVGRDDSGNPVRLEFFRLAESEDGFRDAIAYPRKTAEEKGERLVEFLQRAMLHATPLTDPEDLAWFLASYAREARIRIEQAADLPALATLRQGLEEALGLQFEGEKGEHFFRASLVQTLFYGVFSSWVMWAREVRDSRDRFNWHEAGWSLHVPMIAGLFSQIATPARLKPLGIDEVLDWAGAVLNRVVREAFFQKFEEEHAVQYFYEPFLKAYDPELRKELGVWFTPPEIVKYQVERVDRVLREELGLADGLADDQVVVLDPCCGTGAYLVETLRRIHDTLKNKGSDALAAQRLKRAAMNRVFGFEILPAPFVVSHLQIGLMLRKLGAPLRPDTSERAGVYLTNSLTGWEPPSNPKKDLPLFPELMEERDAANKVKRDAPILVILGNPPYNAFAGTSPEEEGGLVEPYKEGLTRAVKDGGWGIKKFNLDDLYVRFFRIAERRIDKSGKGVVSYISNFSYLGDPSFVVMRKRFLETFDKLWFDCMNGDSRETGKLTPDGKPDPSVFSTEQTSVGIRKGTAVCLMVRKENRDKNPTVRFQDYWGVTKKKDLLDSLSLKIINRKYIFASPNKRNRYSLLSENVTDIYLEWPMIEEIASFKPSLGVLENRGDSLISIDIETLKNNMSTYLNKNISWENLLNMHLRITQPAARYDPKSTREKILKRAKFDLSSFRKLIVRPMDKRWCYYSDIRPLWNEPRPDYFKQCWEGNFCLVTRRKGVARIEGSPFNFTSSLGAQHSLNTDAYYIPILLKNEFMNSKKQKEQSELFGQLNKKIHITANLTRKAREYLISLGIDNSDKDLETAGLIWMHALAIGYSPAYLSENADGIRQDWPRIPLPATKKALLASAELGRRVAALLDTEKPVEGVTCGAIRPELKGIAVISRMGAGSIDPGRGELDLTAGWGHAGKDGVCMPGKGKIMERACKDIKQKRDFGEKTLDVYLNDVAYWSNVPKKVWEFYIGGYQVIKKWLSYRERQMLGRGLKIEEAEYVTETARRLAALVLLQPMLDKNYKNIKKDPKGLN